MLYEAVRFDRLVDEPWVPARVEDAIAAIVAGADTAFDPKALWPAQVDKLGSLVLRVHSVRVFHHDSPFEGGLPTARPLEITWNLADDLACSDHWRTVDLP